MNEICRLCLSYSTQLTYKLEENSGLLDMIHLGLSVHVKAHKSLPNRICGDCFRKVEEIIKFQKFIINNQSILHEYIDNGVESLQNYLRSKEVVKVEKNDELVEKEYDKLTFVINKENDIEDINQDSFQHDGFCSDDENLLLSPNEQARGQSLSPKTKNKNDASKPPVLQHENILDDTKTATNETKNIQNLDIPQSVIKFKCLTCFDYCNTQADLLRHYNRDHGPKNDKNMLDVPKYTTVQSEDDEAYQCQKCSKVYKTKRAANRHVFGHVDHRPFICKICGRLYKTASDIIRHSRAHDGIRLDCSFRCGYSSVYSSALKEHEKRHTTDFKYKCEKCDKGFQVRTWFEEHQNIHDGVKPFVCHICGLAFHMNRYLTAHRSKVHPMSTELRRHICLHCSLPCDSREALTKHWKEHGIKSKFLCDMCGLTLSNTEQLKFHKNKHLGVRPYSCSTCNKTFIKKSNLKLHEATHTRVSPHVCVKCGKRYTQRSALLRHMRCHREGNAQCNKCGKTFSSQSRADVHTRTCV